MGKERFDKKEWMEKSMQMKGQMHDMIFKWRKLILQIRKLLPNIWHSVLNFIVIL